MTKETKKAKIVILEGKNKGKTINLQFNPSEYTLERISKFDKKSLITRENVKTQYKGGEESDLTLEFLFDTTETGKDVRLEIEPLMLLVTKDSELHAPPPCAFIWSKFIFKGVVSKLSKKFTFFFEDGTPARVRVTITFIPFKTSEEIESEERTHSADLTKKRILKEGDNLWLLAYREYGDPSFWRLIAKVNKIDDPRIIGAGKELILPPREGYE